MTYELVIALAVTLNNANEHGITKAPEIAHNVSYADWGLAVGDISLGGPKASRERNGHSQPPNDLARLRCHGIAAAQQVMGVLSDVK